MLGILFIGVREGTKDRCGGPEDAIVSHQLFKYLWVAGNSLLDSFHEHVRRSFREERGHITSFGEMGERCAKVPSAIAVVDHP